MIQIYVNVDSDGNITEGLMGSFVIPEKEFNFFFMSDHIIDDLDKYKVVLDGFAPKLQHKEVLIDTGVGL